MNRHTIEKALTALKPRVFLFHDIHAGPPVFFHTRWAMSYLPGPLTRKQVRDLATAEPETPSTEDEDAAAEPVPRPTKPMELPVQYAPPPPPPKPPALSATPPTLPPDVPQVFLSPTVAFEWALRNHEERTERTLLVRERQMVYVPHLLALGTARMLDRKRGVDHQETVVRLIQPGEGPLKVDWKAGQRDRLSRDDLSPGPVGEGVYAPVPSTLARPRDLKRLAKEFSDYVYYNVSATIPYNPALDVYGAVDESPRDFRERCEEKARDGRDAELKKARAKMDQKMSRVQQRLRREQRELAADQEELEARKREKLLSLGESALNLFSRQGRRRATSMVSRASRKHTLEKQAQADVQESLDAIEDFEQQLEDLKAQWEEQADEISDRWAEKLDQVEKVSITPRRADVTIEFCGLAWAPAWRVTLRDGRQLDLLARELVT
jgi:hypothetical protein